MSSHRTERLGIITSRI